MNVWSNRESNTVPLSRESDVLSLRLPMNLKYAVILVYHCTVMVSGKHFTCLRLLTVLATKREPETGVAFLCHPFLIIKVPELEI
jgi:hypothetical protein